MASPNRQQWIMSTRQIGQGKSHPFRRTISALDHGENYQTLHFGRQTVPTVHMLCFSGLFPRSTCSVYTVVT